MGEGFRAKGTESILYLVLPTAQLTYQFNLGRGIISVFLFIQILVCFSLHVVFPKEILRG